MEVLVAIIYLNTEKSAWNTEDTKYQLLSIVVFPTLGIYPTRIISYLQSILHKYIQWNLQK